MGYKYDEATILDVAVEAALELGISQLTFGSLAKRSGINDRSIVYYFPTKEHLLSAVVVELGGRLRVGLDEAFGSEPLSPQELLDRAWPVLASPRFDRVFGLLFELVGLAGGGVEPYVHLAPELIRQWIDWLTPRVAISDQGDRRSAAAAVLAQIDGLLLLRLTAGPRVANQAARSLGIA